MQSPTYQQIAESFRLWQEYADRDGTMTEAEFDALTVEQRIEILTQAFGADEPRA